MAPGAVTTRAWVGWLLLLPLACGESSRAEASSSAGAGGRSQSGGRGGSSAGGGAAAGRASAGGGTGAAGGAALAGQNGTGASGGAAGLSGDAGEAGAAGSPSPTFMCQGTYDVCGCGCCGGVQPNPGCYYPEHGDDLVAIKAKDQAAGMSSTCAQAGCAIGTHLACCETGAEDMAASYQWTFWSDDTGHVWLTRKLGDRCTALVLPIATGIGYDFPEQWPVDDSSTRDGTCDSLDRSPVRAAIGALGFVHPTPTCRNSFDVDFTLFLTSDNGTLDAVRFKVNGLTFQSNGGSVCP